jgi:adenine-specific DNA-methyltransferase
MLKAADEIIKKSGGVSAETRSEYTDWIDNNSDLSGGEKAYRYLDDEGQVYRFVSLRAPEPRTDPKFHIPLVHPVTGKPCAIPPNGFSRTPQTLQTMIKSGEIIFGQDETTQPQQKRLLTKESKRQISSVIQDGRKGKAYLDQLGLDFPYCHPVSLYEELVAATTGSHSNIVLDHFAGSATTGHAIVNLNRKDGLGRRFILVEMGQCFDTVMLPRIKKITFTPEWKDGKPKRMATQEEAERSPRIVKYICLESYEDALNNIEFDDASGQQALKFDDYLIN